MPTPPPLQRLIPARSVQHACMHVCMYVHTHVQTHTCELRSFSSPLFSRTQPSPRRRHLDPFPLGKAGKTCGRQASRARQGRTGQGRDGYGMRRGGVHMFMSMFPAVWGCPPGGKCPYPASVRDEREKESRGLWLLSIYDIGTTSGGRDSQPASIPELGMQVHRGGLKVGKGGG